MPAHTPRSIVSRRTSLGSVSTFATTDFMRSPSARRSEGVFRCLRANLCHDVKIRVRDNGIGIPAEIKDKLFQPFFTTKPTGEGTGLGLSISWDIVTQQHGGTIDVATCVGEFTEFTVRLPRSSVAAPN